MRFSTLLVAAAAVGLVAAAPATEEQVNRRLVKGVGPGRNWAFREGETPERRLTQGVGPGRNNAFKEVVEERDEAPIANDLGFTGGAGSRPGFAWKRHEETLDRRLTQGVGPGRNNAFKEAVAERDEAPIANDLGFTGGAGSRPGFAWKRDDAPIANDLGFTGGAGSRPGYAWKRDHEAKREFKEAKAQA